MTTSHLKIGVEPTPKISYIASTVESRLSDLNGTKGQLDNAEDQ
jgi:hypothetical protein